MWSVSIIWIFLVVDIIYSNVLIGISMGVLALDCNISSDEMSGLEALYHYTDGDNWSNQLSINGDDILSAWYFPSPLSAPCSEPWYGLTCLPSPNTGNCGVVGLNLEYNSLLGILPTELGLLSNLAVLALDENRIVGQLPSTINQLQSLHTLSITFAGLVGPLPPELFHLTNLQNLVLSDNYFHASLPTEIGYLVKLEILAFSTSSLYGRLPTELGKLVRLQELLMLSNSLSGSIPSELGLISALKMLELTSNLLTGWIPPEIASCSLLQQLDLSSNTLSGSVPAVYFSAVDKIGMIGIESNHLTGSIHFNLTLLDSLTMLNMGNNYFTGSITVATSSNSPLQALYISSCLFTGSLVVDVQSVLVELAIEVNGNYLSGPLPKTFGANDAVTALMLNSNFFSSTVPSQYGSFVSLTQLYLGVNILSGAVPSELGKLTALEELSMDHNLLSRSLPEEIYYMRALVSLVVNNNLITGTISALISNSAQLQEFSASYNQLSGPLPSRIGSSLFADLVLDNNHLTGPVPPDVAVSASEGLGLILYSNHFTGTVDFLVSNTTTFTASEALIGSNLFTGCVPSLSYVSLAAADLGLEYNYLSGSFPSAFLSFNLQTLLINSNFFTGLLPRMPTDADITTLVAGLNMFSGPIPIDYAVINTISALDLSSNQLTGTIPDLLFSISALNTLALANNSLIGQISRIRFGDYLSHLDLSSNKLNGSVPRHLGRELSVMSFLGNQFSGEINIECSSASHLTSLLIGSNRLLGNVSSLACLQNLTVLSIENNSFTGTLKIVESLPRIQQLIVNDNRFTGTLSSALGSLSQLKVLMVANNRLSGRTDNVFNTTLQTLLTAVDLSSNDFTGPIPSNIFELPNLESFASVKTCFSGSIPSTVCGCSTLKVLLLDGVTSGLGCQKKFNLVPSSDAYIPRNGPLKGGIPECLWTALPLLTSLHLSSNGLTGTIGVPSSSSNLTSIVLSYNQLSGTIPAELLSLPFTTLELSNNRLKGVVDGVLTKSNAVVYLHNNRLSGYLPASFVNGSQISVMEGNLIDCNAEHPKPGSDSHAADTTCGSSSLNDSLLMWAVLCGILGLILLLPFVPFLLALLRPALVNRLNGMVDAVGNNLRTVSLLRTRNRSTSESDSFDRYLECLQHLLTFQVAFLVVISILLCVPVYLILKFVGDSEYRSHTFQYQWLLSATFLTGVPAAVSVILLWTMSVLLFVREMLVRPTITVRSTTTFSRPVGEKTVDCGSRQWLRVVGCLLFALVHFILMCGVNVAYLYIILSGKFTVEVMTATQVAVSGVKVLWDSVIIPRALRLLQWVVGEDVLGDDERLTALPHQSYLILKFSCAVLSAIVIPFIVSLFVNSLCFLDLFVPQSVVNENFFYNIANRVECITVHLKPLNVSTPSGPESIQPPDMSDCISFGSVQDYSTEFYPPFTYSFQCGSGILTSYVPVLVYSFAFRLLSLVWSTVWDSTTCSRWGRDRSDKPSDRPNSAAAGMGPIIRVKADIDIEDNVTDENAHLEMTRKRIRKVVHGGQVLTISMLYCLILLTFGLSNPYLAGIVIFSGVMEISWHRVQLTELLGCNEASLSQFDNVVAGLWEVPSRCVWACIHLASVFWGLMVFDMIGDTDVLHPRRAWWGPFIVCIFPCVLRVGTYIWTKISLHGNLITNNTSDTLASQSPVRCMTESVDTALSRTASADSLSMKLLPASDGRPAKVLTYLLRDEHNSKF
jgi:Leucine-rich repeat (LRR) protein